MEHGYNGMSEWNMDILGWVWLLVPLRGRGYHGNGEEKVMVVEELSHLKQMCKKVRKLCEY